MKPTYSLFPKLFNDVSVERLAEIIQETGFDSVDLVIRDGYWVTHDNLAQEAEAYVRFLQQKGIKVEFATTPYSIEMLLDDPTPLEVFRELGIEGFRLSYIPYDDTISFHSQLQKAHSQMEKMAELCSNYKVKAVYQVHHGYNQLIQHSNTALTLIKDLPAEYVGIMLDPGNQFREGRENFQKAFSILGDHMAAIGIKDIMPTHDAANSHLPNKGWTESWAPCQDGIINWTEVGEGLQKVDNNIVVNLQPFYHPQNQDLLISTLKEELTYIKGVF